VFSNILVAHIEGGESSGSMDESIRHSISKLSHIHFTANDLFAKKLEQLGEDPRNIYPI
jgi:UDP-N-acetylglucosamine 2-epimerase (hydrolysing)